MNVRHLTYFVAVVDHGSVTRAAVALRVAQPSLSQAIRSLESDLRTQLFHRVGRGLVLSPEGQALIGPIRQVLRQLALVESTAQGVRGLDGGRVDVATLPAFAIEPVALWASLFRRRHDKVSLRLRESDAARDVPELVHSGECEVGFAERPLVASRPGLVTRELLTQHLLIAFPPGSVPADEDEPLPLEALRGVPLVMGLALRADIEEALRACGVSPSVVVETTHREPITQLVLFGAGAAFLPFRLALDAHRAGAVVRLIEPAITRTVTVIHRDGGLSPAAAAFVDLVTAEARNWDRAVARRMERGMSRLRAGLDVDAKVQARTRSEVEPIRLWTDGDPSGRP